MKAEGRLPPGGRGRKAPCLLDVLGKAVGLGLLQKPTNFYLLGAPQGPGIPAGLEGLPK